MLSKRHRPVGKDSGQTSRIERLNNTLRQRISRLVRKMLSCSKKRENYKITSVRSGLSCITLMPRWRKVVSRIVRDYRFLL
jgi:hypothetical protein